MLLATTNVLVLLFALGQIDPTYQEQPLSYWREVIRNHDEERLAAALDAIRDLGPKASRAVPELTGLLTSPFVPIELGKDSDEQLMDKLYEIEIRSAAIDALGSIGPDAAPATLPIIEWTLTLRVMPPAVDNKDGLDRFIDLAMLEMEYRTRVIDAIRQFGKPAVPAISQLLRSTDPEKRQFAAAILGMDAVPLAAHLLKSTNCEKERLGVTILQDLEPLLPKPYVAHLSRTMGCNELALQKTKR
jgi:HEAT repeat protein